ncbi:endonuclease [Salinivibrio sp. ML198]|uniref:ExeM/NucH family extracellular endonuclease n=1 Tax=unclassified Salinivibrio TaxID=2636825 RepID=UPI000987920C|nr:MULTISPECIES: ExeM/NucH family extracellular endonuclease [unclassified Salinivibrio]OOE68221.1 endonuclease [Salinivibrio sp. IB868]OOE75373.1 endonuclease [Salinivibrio sp. IB870]OOE80381.1 endonuclease [Salinivibrio sp. ML198]
MKKPMMWSPLALVMAGIALPAAAKAPLTESYQCGVTTPTPIYAIQGDGARSPLVPDGKYSSDKTYAVQGVVTAVTQGLYKGVWIQDPQGDGNPATSDGLFVYLRDAQHLALAPGDTLCASGKIKEYYGHTQLGVTDGQVAKGPYQGDVLPTAIRVGAEETLDQALERYEGMKVTMDADSELVITRNFGFDYDAFRNNMVLSHQAPLYKPTQLYPALTPGAEALAEKNAQNQLYIETDQKAKDGEIPYFPGLDAEQGYLRIGDRIERLSGVLGYSYSQYRLVATNTITAGDIVHRNDRQPAPKTVPGTDIKVASFNVLNYFTSASAVGGPLNVTCEDQADADASRGCNRGAKTAAEFELQRSKIVNALTAMDADIVGLMEIENNGFAAGSAIDDLVTQLNAQFADPRDHYQFVEPSEAEKNQGAYFGSDAIMVGMIYRPATVALAGNAQAIPMPEQHISGESPDGETKALDKYQRDSLIQRFMINDQPLSVVVNHFKSKGSGCYEDWVAGEFDSETADLQGRCNEFRVSAAVALRDRLNTVEGDVLILGDLNAYAQEDPVRVLTDYQRREGQRDILTAAGTEIRGVPMHATGQPVEEGLGYTNLATDWLGDKAYSYSFSGELGALDHALANASLASKVVGVEEWHINSVESTLFEYSRQYTGDLVKSNNAFSSSDHDPVLISLDYPEPVVPVSVTVNNRSILPIVPLLNGQKSPVHAWMKWRATRTFNQASPLVQSLALSADDRIAVAVKALGLFPVYCGSAPADTPMTVTYTGFRCQLNR